MNDQLEHLTALLGAVAAENNALIDAGKVRPIRKFAPEAHAKVVDAINALKAMQPASMSVLSSAEALLMDLRLGRKTSSFIV